MPIGPGPPGHPGHLAQGGQPPSAGMVVPPKRTTRPGISWPRMRRASRLLSQRSEPRSEEHTSELQSHLNLVCRLLLEKKKKMRKQGGEQSAIELTDTC